MFILSKFITKLVAANHLIMWERTIFDTKVQTLKFLLKIMTLVSSAHNIGSDTSFTHILMGRSFKCITNKRGLRIDLRGTACFNVS